ncbi:hypothetical protein E3P86_01135 [Wallemia ichthyophaga]|uniref:Telomere replication protein EST3 n=1 Tax=Wallemia ichthyophaga TaxID=245174 RepID=A0A4T0J958_WALIC|nr:hypothetical protein E3P86_01135 [Wallemia ichthyophaga]
MESLNPWIKAWFLEYYNKNVQENIAINEYTNCKPKKVQLIEFRKFLCTQTPIEEGTNSSESWWAIASDKDIRIPCYFTRNALIAFEGANDDLRFTQLGGSIVFLLQWKAQIGKIDSLNQISDGTNRIRHKPSLYFVVDDFVIKGCLGEPVFGDPTDIMGEQLISDFTLNQLRSGSSSVSAGALSRKSSILGRKSSKIAPLSRHATLDENDEQRQAVNKSMSPYTNDTNISRLNPDTNLAAPKLHGSNPGLTRHPNVHLFRHSQWPVWMTLDEEICWMSEDEELLLSKTGVYNPNFSGNSSKELPFNQIGYEGYFSSQQMPQSIDRSLEKEKTPNDVNSKEKKMKNEESIERLNHDLQNMQDLPNVPSQAKLSTTRHPPSQSNQVQKYLQLSQRSNNSQHSQQCINNQLLSTDGIDSSFPLPNESQVPYNMQQSIKMHQQNLIEGDEADERSSRHSADTEMRNDEDSSGQSHDIMPVIDSNHKSMDVQMTETSARKFEEDNSNSISKGDADAGSSNEGYKSRIIRPAPLLLKTGLAKTSNRSSTGTDIVLEQLRRSNYSADTATNDSNEGLEIVNKDVRATSSKQPGDYSTTSINNLPIPRPSSLSPNTRSLLELQHQNHKAEAAALSLSMEIQESLQEKPKKPSQQPQSPERQTRLKYLNQLLPFSSPAFEEEDCEMQIRKPGRGIGIQRKRKGFKKIERLDKGKRPLDFPADIEREEAEDMNDSTNSAEIVSTPSSKTQYFSSSGEVVLNTPLVKVINTSEPSSLLTNKVASSPRKVRRKLESNENEFTSSPIPSLGSIESSFPMQAVYDYMPESMTESQRREHLQMSQSQKPHSQSRSQSQPQSQVVESQVSFNLSQSQFPIINNSNDKVGEDGTFFKGTQVVADETPVPESREAFEDMSQQSQERDTSLAMSQQSQKNLYEQSQQHSQGHSQDLSQDRSQFDTSNGNNSLLPNATTQEHADPDFDSQPITASQLHQQTIDIMDDVYDNSQDESMDYMKSPPAGQRGQQTKRDIYVDPLPRFKYDREDLYAILSMEKMKTLNDNFFYIC